MRRLTSNKPVNEMGMVELAYNSCYAKDGEAWFRDYQMDMDARSFCTKLLNEAANIPCEFSCNEEFDEYMEYLSQEGYSDPAGIVMLLYRNIWAMADLRSKLMKYEDTGLTPEQILEMTKEE